MSHPPADQQGYYATRGPQQQQHHFNQPQYAPQQQPYSQYPQQQPASYQRQYPPPAQQQSYGAPQSQQPRPPQQQQGYPPTSYPQQGQQYRPPPQQHQPPGPQYAPHPDQRRAQQPPRGPPGPPQSQSQYGQPQGYSNQYSHQPPPPPQIPQQRSSPRQNPAMINTQQGYAPPPQPRQQQQQQVMPPNNPRYDPRSGQQQQFQQPQQSQYAAPRNQHPNGNGYDQRPMSPQNGQYGYAQQPQPRNPSPPKQMAQMAPRQPQQQQRPFDGNGYSRSQPDLSQGMQNMSINDAPRNNSLPGNQSQMQPPQVAPYASQARPQSPNGYSQNHRPESPNMYQRRQSPQNYGNHPPQPQQQQRQRPAPQPQVEGRKGPPPPLTTDGFAVDYSNSTYASQEPENPPPPNGSNYGNDWNPKSPTAITDDQTYNSMEVHEGERRVQISTNKIPPAAAVGNTVISPLAAEYRRDMVSPPPQARQEQVSPQRNSKASDGDFVNQYLDEEIREHERASVSSRGQEQESLSSRKFSQSSEKLPPLNTAYQSDIQPLRSASRQSNQSHSNGNSSTHLPLQSQKRPSVPYSYDSQQSIHSDRSQTSGQYNAPPQQQYNQQPQSFSQQPYGNTGYQQQQPPPPQRQFEPKPQSPMASQIGDRPPPKRQYTSNNDTSDASFGDTTKQKLTVEAFENYRLQAKNRPHDPKAQLDWAKKMEEASTTLAMLYENPETPTRANSHVDSRAEKKNHDAWLSQAHKIVKKLASQTYPDAIFFLACSYSGGTLTLPIDHDKAYELYNRAAKLDQAEAAYRVAVCNEIGAGTKKDTDKALIWYKKAAQLGDVSAMYKLGMISLNGLLGQRKSFAEAVTWFQRAADRADADTPHAVHELGLLYERVDNLDMSAVNEQGTATVIQRDERKAFELFLKAAKLGYPPSQFRLGCCYEYGTLGCNIDPKRSIAWYSRAAEKGEPESELALSGWYLTGSDGILQQSDTEAYLWARRAAEKGLAKAEYALGYFSEVGIGVKSSIEEARRWYFKAAAQKHPKAMARLQEMRARE